MEDQFNQFDPNAIQASIDGEVVGYIPRDQAALFKKAFVAAGAKGKAVKVGALIVGGWDLGPRGAGSFGVNLDVPLPPRVRKVQNPARRVSGTRGANRQIIVARFDDQFPFAAKRI